ncbi:hypothetical protein SmJEL517_g01520 [Synchytrium microbalum]|uniref:RNA helicase n=1 Tax=Synchytrium microbalum TaxID=1806994 RepID=A0A507C9T2_9FUNG|nr:uncharacterized protein SmJEL517_g01520 [Synchytrium microbalum]TPX36362.1 hypothetical protein SmJEL517_g01520 [Synchytrium microbalum]
MGKRRARFNEKARASSSHATQLPHANPRHSSKNIGLIAQTAPAQIKNQAITAVQHDEEPTYQSSDTAIPDILIPGVDGQHTKAAEMLAKLPNRPDGKITSKKRKRLEKFIEQSLKKEERVRLIEKLSKQHFSSDLLKSSKNIGQKATGRKHLSTLDMYNDYEEEMLDGSDNDDMMTDSDTEEIEGNRSKRIKVESITKPMASLPQPSIPSKMPIVESTVPVVPVIDHSEGAMKTSVAPKAISQPGSALKKVAPVAVLGSALKRPQLGSALKKQELGSSLKQPTTNKPKNGTNQHVKAPESDSSDSSSDEEMPMVEEALAQPKVRKGAWMSDVVGGETMPSIPIGAIPSSLVQRQPTPPPTPKRPLVLAPPSSEKAVYVSLPRPSDLAVARLSLPVTGEEQPIMECIIANDVTILCGATGSGKTTQVPQFLLEAGFGDPKHPKFPGIIGVTQPRRVAAVSVSKRVAEETGWKKGQVAYQIRFDATTVKDGVTRVKFMTDGILLRELSTAATIQSNDDGSNKLTQDLLLTKYSCIIVDEAHERTVGTDILIGWLARIVKLRNSGKIKGVKPLKLVIMSATLRVEDFTSNQTLFPPPQIPPVIKVEGRQFKVTIHYNRKTNDMDYLGDAFKKICKVHTKLPPGGILVFLSGQGEIQSIVNKLRKTFPASSQTARDKDTIVEKQEVAPIVEGLFEETETGAADDDKVVDIDADGLDDNDVDQDSEEEDVDVLDGESDDDDADESWVPSEEQRAMPLHVLPLYSLLPTAAQLRVFESPPPGSRLCVIATNVAETSLTIPNIRYVVDSGKVKERRFEARTGTQTYSIGWTSKASSDQRAGRAGRVGMGHCYRLFSSAVFNDRFEDFSQPEILKTPVEGVVLQMKAMGVHQVVNFPFPTAPDRDGLRVAEKLLIHLGAVDATDLRVTDLGRLMARVPVSPRYAKMLAVALEQSSSLLAYTISMVAGLSSGDPFIRDDDVMARHDDDEEEGAASIEKDRRRQKRRDWYRIMQTFSGENPTSDALRLLHAVGAYTAESVRCTPRQLENFCESHYIRSKAMSETLRLRRQLTTIIKSELPSHRNVRALIVDPFMAPPDAKAAIALRQIILSGYPDRIATLVDASGTYIGKNTKSGKPIYRTMWAGQHEIAQIHPSSCIYSVRPPPKYVLYEEVVGREERIAADAESVLLTRSEMKSLAKDPNSINPDEPPKPKKTWLKGCAAISESWLSTLGPASLCTQGNILEEPSPRYDAAQDAIVGFAAAKYGPHGWELPVRQVPVTGTERFVWFARELLEGKVVLESVSEKAGKKQRKDLKHVMGSLSQNLVGKPSILCKPWSKAQSRVVDLLNTLSSNQVSSRKALLLKWTTHPSFLLEQLLAWFPPQMAQTLKENWPPVVIQEHLGEIDSVKAKPKLMNAPLQKIDAAAPAIDFDVDSD